MPIDQLEATESRLNAEVDTTIVAMEAFYLDHARYTKDISELAFRYRTSADATLTIVTADATGYRLCAVDSATGAWASFVSPSDGEVTIGDSGFVCSAY